jgi:hypothetical protein
MMGENLLELNGWKIDSISRVSGVMEATEGVRTVLSFKKWHKMAGLDESPERGYITGGTWTDAYWRTLSVMQCSMEGLGQRA